MAPLDDQQPRVKARRPMYPGYRRAPRRHVLALDDNNNLVTADGEDLPSTDYLAWKTSALDRHLDVRVDSVLGWRYFREAIADEQATVRAACSKSDHNPRVVSISWRRGNDWCSLFSAAGWGDGATTDALETHQAALDHLGVGQEASPAALGQATMRAHLDRSYTTLSTTANADLLAHLIGGRAELEQPGEWDTATEIDRTMAYVAECRKPLPGGSAGFWDNCTLEQANEQPHWYGECTVYIHRPLKRGPFPLCTGRGKIQYPKRPGQYIVWLWKGEAQDCLDAGCTVIPRRVWVWSRSEAALARWAEWIFQKRRSAPTEQVASYVKKSAVAAIGWHAMGPQTLTVKRADELPDNAPVIVNASGFPTSYAVQVEAESQPRQMVHWASYIWSEARRTLYRRELDELATGNRVLSSNFDSLVLAQPSSLPTSTGLGEWRAQVLSNVVITARRQLISDQHTTTPGIPAEQRAARFAELARQIAAERERKEVEQALWKADHPLEWLRQVERWRRRSGSQVNLMDEEAGAAWRPRRRRRSIRQR